ncbi:MAG: 7-cyano-7-deazaguanine synthase [Chlamydiales bacterium]|jgi:7-cyano-7-deazaguanine synthase
MKAVVLLSGGLDSTVLLSLAISAGRECHALSFDYGQRHRIELESAKAVAKHYSIKHSIISIDSNAFGNSSLVSDLSVPKNRTAEEMGCGIPNTYVPARNTLFLAYATGKAELIGAEEIYIGVNAMDRSGYPDCRPEYLAAFQSLLNLSTRQAIEGRAPKLMSPLADLDKTAIISRGQSLDAPIHLSLSCYDPASDATHCGECDACILRQKGFVKARVSDPTRWAVKN